MEEIAYAKINLALHVRVRRADGYHEIETIFAFAEDGDLLRVQEAETLSLEIDGPFAAALSGENLVLKAAEALRDHCGVAAGAALSLDKRLPVASGIGGGSADAAAALRLLVRFWNLNIGSEELLGIASSLGADVPACLSSNFARGIGKGDILTREGIGQFAAMPLLLVNPGVPVSTAAVFAAWDGKDRGALPSSPMDGRNDLEAPALLLAPEIGEVLGALSTSPGLLLGRMSGSGATCFALFEKQEDARNATLRIGRAHPHWWQLSTRLR